MRSIAMICLLASVALGLSACGQSVSSERLASAAPPKSSQPLTCRDGFAIHYGARLTDYTITRCGDQPKRDSHGARGLNGTVG